MNGTQARVQPEAQPEAQSKAQPEAQAGPPQTWWGGFEVSGSTSVNTIDEIQRFVELYLQNISNEIFTPGVTSSDDDTAFASLVIKVRRVNIHFDNEVDGGKQGVKAKLEGIVAKLGIVEGTKPHLHNRFLAVMGVIVGILFNIASKLIRFVHTTRPSTKIITQLRGYLGGIHEFIDTAIGVSVETKQTWSDMMTKLDQPVAHMSAFAKLMSHFTHASQSPLAELETDGRFVAHQLHRQRVSRDPKSAERITELEDEELRTLRELRSRLERSLTVDAPPVDCSLHAVREHLFQPKSYFAVSGEVETIFSARREDRADLILLLKKRLEQKALEELAKMVQRATSCYSNIGTSFQDSKYATVLEHMLELVWLQRHTWDAHHGGVETDVMKMNGFLEGQHAYPVGVEDKFHTSAQVLDTLKSNEKVPMSMLQHVYNVLLKPSSLQLRAQKPTQVGGDPTDVAQELAHSKPSLAITSTQAGQTSPLSNKQQAEQEKGQGDSAWKEGVLNGPNKLNERPVSPVFGMVLQQRVIVRDLIRGLMLAIANVERIATIVVGERAIFSDTVMLPFLKPISEQWGTVLSNYLKPMIDVPDNDPIMVTSKEGERQSSSRATQRTFERVAANLSAGNMLLLQVIKAARFFIQIGAAFVSQKVFNESYMRKVFAEGRDPPPLKSMLFLMASIDATAHLMIVLVLVLSSFAFKTDTNTFMIDDVLLADVLTEFAVSSTVFIVIGLLMGDVLRRKRYFQYADQGQVVSTAYRSVLLSLCALNFVVPYSMLIS